jgi:hypothetical protein
MKNRKIYFYFTALFAAVFVLSACFNYMDTAGNTGGIRINLGSSSSRYTVSDDEKVAMTYTVTLTSPGQKPVTEILSGVASKTIKVFPGTWDVKIEAEQKRSGNQYRVLKGYGEVADVVVEAEKITEKVVNMTTTATRVYTWDDLCNDLADTALGNNLEYIEIADNLTATKTAESRGTVRRKIILCAEKNISIERGSALKAPLLKIYNVLVLEGKITIDGDKQGSGNDNTSALINVENGGHLEMQDEVTLCNNFSSEGGGVCVAGGRFDMRGGTISGNTADRGGGVFVGPNAVSFTKTGGTIYGANSGDLSNKANAAGGGHAVYINGIGHDTY